MSALNTGTCQNPEIMKCIRSLFWLSGSILIYLPGTKNIAADSASCVGTPGYLKTLWPYTDASPIQCHMYVYLNIFLCLTDFPIGNPGAVSERGGAALLPRPLESLCESG